MKNSSSPRARLPGLIAAAGNPLVELKTSAGPIVLELYPRKPQDGRQLPRIREGRLLTA